MFSFSSTTRIISVPEYISSQGYFIRAVKTRAIGEHGGRQGRPPLGHRAAGCGHDDRLGLPSSRGLAPGYGLSCRAATHSPAADVGHGAKRDAQIISDLDVGLAGIRP